jgi:hypothetical protein
MKQLVKKTLARLGWELVHSATRDHIAIADLSAADQAIVARVSPYTLTSLDRRAGLILAVDHIVRQRVPGDIVECGVWRGGSMMAAALALLARGDTSRHLWLYDTYEGMSEPTEADRSHTGESAAAQLQRTERGQGVWCEAGLADVQANLWSTGYPRERIHFVQGKVEDTIPGPAGQHLPAAIALLRLDTDWYASTQHELLHLYPLLQRRGLLIIDDYGHWQGARQAVDEYFAHTEPPPFLHRVDYTARLLVKP